MGNKQSVSPQERERAKFLHDERMRAQERNRGNSQTPAPTSHTADGELDTNYFFSTSTDTGIDPRNIALYSPESAVQITALYGEQVREQEGRQQAYINLITQRDKQKIDQRVRDAAEQTERNLFELGGRKIANQASLIANQLALGLEANKNTKFGLESQRLLGRGTLNLEDNRRQDLHQLNLIKSAQQNRLYDYLIPSTKNSVIRGGTRNFIFGKEPSDLDEEEEVTSAAEPPLPVTERSRAVTSQILKRLSNPNSATGGVNYQPPREGQSAEESIIAQTRNRGIKLSRQQINSLLANTNEIRKVNLLNNIGGNGNLDVERATNYRDLIDAST